MRRAALDLRLAADDDAPAPRLERLLDTGVTVDRGPGREVGRFDVLHQSFDIDLATCVHISLTGVKHLRHVVRRHVCRHTHGDARCPIDKQVWDARWQHRRLLQRIVEVELEVNRILIYIPQHFLSQSAHACLGVSHSGRAVAVHRAEVALPIDQRVPHGPILGQSD